MVALQLQLGGKSASMGGRNETNYSEARTRSLSFNSQDYVYVVVLTVCVCVCVGGGYVCAIDGDS